MHVVAMHVLITCRRPRRCTRCHWHQVRDRAAASLKLLTADDVTPAKLVVGGKLPMNPRAMTRSLREYQARPVPGSFTFDALPAVEEEAVATKVCTKGAAPSMRAG